MDPVAAWGRRSLPVRIRIPSSRSRRQPTSATIFRDRDKEAKDSGQFGVAFKYYAENLGSGTELGFYFMNYHSKLPLVSFMSTDASCARREGNNAGPGGVGIDVTNTFQYIEACKDNPVFTNGNALIGNSPSNQLLADAIPLILSNPLGIGGDVGLTSQLPGAAIRDLLSALPTLAFGGDPNATGTTRSAVALDTARIFFEYPENLKMFEMFGNATTDLNPIGLGQGDPALVRFIVENCLAHPQHDVKLFPVSCSGLGPT